MERKKKQSIYLHKQAEWAELYRQGLSFTQIAKQAGTTYGTVQNVIRDVIEQRPKKTYAKIAEEWANLYEEGWTTQEIGAKFQVGGSTVHKYLKEMGVEFRRAKTNIKRKYDHLTEKWVELYREGKSLKEIADKYGMNTATVHLYIKEKTEMREYHETSRQHTANDHYFDTVDSEEKAYWLGFVFSTGCLIRRAGLFAVQVSVAEKDKERLDRFKEVIESDNPYEVNNTTLVYQLRINSKVLFHGLQKQGLKEDKLDTLTYPESLDLAFHSAFILGYYEGHGSCYNRLRKNRRTPRTHLNLYGTESMLKTIQGILQHEIQVTLPLRWQTTQPKGKPIRICSLQTEIRSDIERIANWLYQGKTEYSKSRDIRELLKQSEKGLYM